jgi:predicted RNA binding protein YcfA (HicA-like mRNA interferase family)
MLTGDKVLREILKNAEREGWVFDRRKRHIIGKHPNGQTATISATPSDWRVTRNIQRDLRLK